VKIFVVALIDEESELIVANLLGDAPFPDQFVCLTP